MPRTRTQRKLLLPRVTGPAISYRNTRGGRWRLNEYDLLYALDMYADGEKIGFICHYFGISSAQLYRNIGPYLEIKEP